MLPRKVSHSQLEKWILQIVEERELMARDLDKTMSPTEMEFYRAGLSNGARDLISTLVVQGIIEREY